MGACLQGRLDDLELTTPGRALAELAGLYAAKFEMFAGLPAVSTASEIADRLEAVEAVLAAAHGALAAEARRKAVLKSLASLGYEVGSELETSWVESGQVVLRRAAQRGYGVELSGPASADRLQMRVVAFGSGPADAARDRDAETLWCNTVEQLREDLARAGARLEIERALPVGAAAVKRVQLAGVAEVAAERIAPKAGRALE